MLNSQHGHTPALMRSTKCPSTPTDLRLYSSARDGLNTLQALAFQSICKQLAFTRGAQAMEKPHLCGKGKGRTGSQMCNHISGSLSVYLHFVQSENFLRSFLSHLIFSYLQSSAFLRGSPLKYRLVLTSQMNYSEVNMISWFSINIWHVNATITLRRSS